MYDAEGRMKIAEKFNQIHQNGEIGGISFGETITMFREQILPYMKLLIFMTEADLLQIWHPNVIGDSFIRCNTGFLFTMEAGVGWGRRINGPVSDLLDGSGRCDRRLKSMLFGM